MLQNGQIVPMYEEHRRKIYYSYQDMKKQNSYLQISMNKTETKYRLMEFKKRFFNFFPEVAPFKRKFENTKEYAYVEKLYFEPNLIKKEDAQKITFISMKFLKYLGITDIGYKRKQQDSLPFA